MGFINLAEKTINAKLVYYGVGLGGKTTSLKVVHGMLCPNDEVKLVSINTEQDSTLLFDFLPIDLGQVEGFKIRIQGFTVPGQQKYVVMRKYVLQGADAVVLVVDSRRNLIDENLQSIEDLKENLQANGLDWRKIPLVIQYNKQDLPDLATTEELNAALRFRDAPVFETVAPQGLGVFEAFTEVVGQMVEDKVRQYGLGRGDKDPWAIGEEARSRLRSGRADMIDPRQLSESLVSVAIPEGECATPLDAESSQVSTAQDALDEVLPSQQTSVEELFGAEPAADSSERTVPATEQAHAAPAVESSTELLGQAINSNLELAELYSELAEYKSRLEQKNRELVEANQLISHDLKKPLTVFKNVLHLLSKDLLGPLNDKQKSAIENCSESVAYMEELVGDILDSSRLDYDGVQFAFEELDMTTLVGGIVGRLRYDLEESAVRLRVEPLPIVRGDSSALTKVFMNLIGNAINYRDPAKEQCEIRVLAEEIGDTWFFRIEDNGIGIPPENRDLIFDKFARGTNAAEVSGTGLGLYIVQQMVRGHGGDLFVESEVGEGTCFVVKLPKEPAQAIHSPVD